MSTAPMKSDTEHGPPTAVVAFLRRKLATMPVSPCVGDGNERRVGVSY